MNKQELYQLLDQKHIEYQRIDHPAIFTMEQMNQLHLPQSCQIAKNLFLKDDKKRKYYLLTAKETKQIDLKQFQQKFSTRRLSFASENDLMELLGLTKGSVTPFGLLNDKDCKVHFYLDNSFLQEIIGCHPMINDATVYLKSQDLLDLIKENGNSIELF